MGALCARTQKRVYVIADRLSSNTDWSGFSIFFSLCSLATVIHLVLSYISLTQPITSIRWGGVVGVAPWSSVSEDERFRVENVLVLKIVSVTATKRRQKPVSPLKIEPHGPHRLTSHLKL